MPSKYSLYGQSSSRIYENGKEQVSKDTIIATDGRKARVIARDDNIIKYAELNKKDVTISSIVPMGNYAIAIHFNDGHTTGIYSWSYLNHLGNDKELLWKDYCSRVREHNNKNNKQNYRKVSI